MCCYSTNYARWHHALFGIAQKQQLIMFLSLHPPRQADARAPQCKLCHRTNCAFVIPWSSRPLPIAAPVVLLHRLYARFTQPVGEFGRRISDLVREKEGSCIASENPFPSACNSWWHRDCVRETKGQKVKILFVVWSCLCQWLGFQHMNFLWFTLSNKFLVLIFLYMGMNVSECMFLIWTIGRSAWHCVHG